ncbi:HD domain-containing phosphohydrolase [Chlamydiota bacterium]
MLKKTDFTHEDLDWINDVSFKIRLISAITLPILICLLTFVMGIAFPLFPIIVLGLFEAFINQPYFFIRKHINNLQDLVYINTSIDILIITLFVYFIGTTQIPFISALYLIPIIFSTIDVSIALGLFLASISSFFYTLLVTFIFFEFIPQIQTTGLALSGTNQFLLICFSIVFFYIFSIFAYLPSSRLKNKSSMLQQKTELLSQALSTVQQRADQLGSASEIFREIALSLDINTVMGTILQQIGRILKSERISIMLKDHDDTLYIRASIGISQELVQKTKITIGENISGWVAAHKKPVLIENIDTDPRFSGQNNEVFFTKSLISCPLLVKNNLIGVINISNKKDHTCFNSYELEIIKALSADIAVAIENAKLYSDLKQSSLNTLKSLAVAVDSRDRYTQKHLERVCDFALSIGKKMNLNSPNLINLQTAALLHDIGKIGTSDTILLKEGKLTSLEWKKMKEHPLLSERILNPLGFSTEVLEIVRHHHERYDGNGYPDSKSAETVSLEAYILSAADAFDAMISDRPYRKSLGKNNAISELSHGKRSQFHPQVVDAFISVLNSN